MVEKKLEPFIKNPKTADPREFNKALRELRPFITEVEETVIRNEFKNARIEPEIINIKAPTLKKKEFPSSVDIPLNKVSKPQKEVISSVDIPTNKLKKPKKEVLSSVSIPNKKISQPLKKEIPFVKIPKKPPVPVTEEMRLAARQMKMTDSQVKNLSESVDGLIEIKRSVSRPVYEKVVNARTKDILFGNKVRTKPTGKELKARIEQGDNYYQLVEMHGEEAANAALDAAEKAANSQITTESMKKILKKVGIVKTAGLFGII